MRRWCRTLLLRRGGQAGPVNVSNNPNPMRYMTCHSYHLIQHLGLPVTVKLQTLLLSPAAKTFSFRARYATGTHAGRAWRPSYLESFEATPNFSIPHKKRHKHGRSILCCSRRAPIDFCCCKEACAVCVPEVAAAGAKAAAILGICRMYVRDVTKSNCNFARWMANYMQ